MAETDEHAYQRCLDGDEDALRLLLERYRESLTLFLMNYVYNMEDAEDLMLDAFTVAVSKKGGSSFLGKSSFKTWLFSIGRNLARKHLRHQKLHAAWFRDFEGRNEEAMPEAHILRNERDQKLYAALRSLPEDYRQVVYLLEMESMSVDEAAEITGKSKKQIYNLSFRGKQALREALKGMGIADAHY